MLYAQVRREDAIEQWKDAIAYDPANTYLREIVQMLNDEVPVIAMAAPSPTDGILEDAARMKQANGERRGIFSSFACPGRRKS